MERLREKRQDRYESVRTYLEFFRSVELFAIPRFPTYRARDNERESWTRGVLRSSFFFRLTLTRILGTQSTISRARARATLALALALVFARIPRSATRGEFQTARARPSTLRRPALPFIVAQE